VLKKTITYEDFNGETVSEDFFFHLSKAELVELELSHQGGLSEALQRIVAAEDGKAIIAEFKNIILSAYGQKSLDGRRFIKNEQLREEFLSSEAYSVLFMELVLDAGKAAEFINGVIPEGMAEEAAKIAAAEKPVLEEVPKPEPERRDPYPDGLLTKISQGSITRAEFDTLNHDQALEVQSLVDAGDLRIIEPESQ
jgi:hypothetical protein